MRVAALPVVLSGAGAVFTCTGCQDDVYIRLLEPELETVPITAAPPQPSLVAEPRDAGEDASTPAQPVAPPTVPGNSAPNVDEPTPPAAVLLDATVRDLDAAVVGSGTPPERRPDAEAGATADSGRPVVTLIHHYDFSGTGTVVVDRVGAADGELLGGAELNGLGQAALDGDDDYVNLPNGLLSSLESATLAFWLEWHGGSCWQRIFDIGSSDSEEDVATNAETSFFLTPASCPQSHIGAVTEFVTSTMFHVRGIVYLAQQEAGAAFPVDEPAFAAVTADPDRGLSAYVNGELVAHAPPAIVLAELDDVNVWLGRSQWGQDVNLFADLDDARIYDGAMSAAQIRALYAETQQER